MSPEVASANTIARAAVKPIKVSVDADSLVFVQAQHPAIVTFRIVPDSTTPPLPPPGDGGPETSVVAEPRRLGKGAAAAVATPVPDLPVTSTPPRVKCTADGTFAASCDLAGGWSFDIGPGSLHSAPQTIWVEIPRVDSRTRWTIEARSRWSTTPTIVVVEATAVAPPAGQVGTYAGTITWPRASAGPPSDAVTEPIDAVVTASHVALFDATRALFPDGHVVLARSQPGAPAQATLLPWLSTAGQAPYQVRLDVGELTLDPESGHLTGEVQLVANGARTTTLFLSLARIGDVTAATCSTAAGCPTGQYCDGRMQRCLPGADGGGEIVGLPATPSSTLASAQLAAWQGPLATLVSRGGPGDRTGGCQTDRTCPQVAVAAIGVSVGSVGGGQTDPPGHRSACSPAA